MTGLLSMKRHNEHISCPLQTATTGSRILHLAQNMTNLFWAIWTNLDIDGPAPSFTT